MLISMIRLMKSKKGDFTWGQILAFVLALLILAVMFFISTKSGGDMGKVTDEVSSILS